MDADGECLLYYEIGVNVHLVAVLKLRAVIIRLSGWLDLKEIPYEEMQRGNDKKSGLLPAR